MSLCVAQCRLLTMGRGTVSFVDLVHACSHFISRRVAIDAEPLPSAFSWGPCVQALSLNVSQLRIFHVHSAADQPASASASAARSSIDGGGRAATQASMPSLRRTSTPALPISTAAATGHTSAYAEIMGAGAALAPGTTGSAGAAAEEPAGAMGRAPSLSRALSQVAAHTGESLEEIGCVGTMELVQVRSSPAA